MTEPVVNTSPKNWDEVKTTTCYMCACRCGIRVHLKDGRVRYIEGNPDHPVNKGVLCGKGSAGIMTQYSPARLQAPLKRIGPRGSGDYAEISWDEAMEIATTALRKVRETDPKRLAFFTGRDQSQSLTGFWAAQFGTPNFAAHGGFCSVNMAAGGLYTIGGSFWEFGEPDWERAKYLLILGVAEDHDSNPIKTGLAALKKRNDTGETGRFRKFTREWIAERDDSLDISWLKDDSAESSADLPEPAILATSAMEEMEAIMADLRGILAELGEEVPA